MTEPIRVGLVGAGPWANMVHAPMLAAGPETTLSGIWARRPEAASELAAAFNATPFRDLDALFAASDAIAFCVPPDIQAALALRAAAAGKALLLEKPIALDLPAAERLADAAERAGVPTMVMLSYRFSAAVREFLVQAAGFGAWSARAAFIGGGFLEGSPFATPWRLERGALLDLGPHLLDLVEQCLGPVTSLSAAGDPLGVVSLVTRHEGGGSATLSLSGKVPIRPTKTTLELYGPRGELALDARASGRDDLWAAARSEFAACVRDWRPHELDVRRGLALQRLIAEAESQLNR